MSKRVLAIGDIHGCSRTLEALIKQIRLTNDDILTFVGDYCDRGARSPEVIDYLIDLKLEFPNTRFIKGNHDEMFVKYIKHELNLSEVQTFMYNGGFGTLSQYKRYLGKDTPDNRSLTFDELPDKHKEFWESLEDIIIDEEHKAVFVHGGLRPGVPINEQYTKDLMWIRDTFLRNDYTWGNYTIVHGHTPMTPMEAKRYHDKIPSRFNVDNGCVFGYNLSCVDILTGNLYTEKCKDHEYSDEITKAHGYV